MVLAFELSVRMGLCPVEDATRVRRHLEAAGLPCGFAALPAIRWSAKALISHMTRDKKVRDGRTTFVLTRGIGEAFVSRDVDIDDVHQLLRDAIGN
jgi:3-dehydroquinate synthase